MPAMPPQSPYLVPFDGSFRVAEAPTTPSPAGLANAKDRPDLSAVVEEIEQLQRIFAARDHHSLLLIFQAIDAAGKDGTIRAVTSGVDPSGFQVSSFKRPSSEELDHDFLWRCTKRLPERGRIGIFNRSWYEEVLIVRVHPQILETQRIPQAKPGKKLWRQRCRSIADFEKHLARNGTLILKFFLNVSKDEQARRLIARADERDKHWKFEAQDVQERAHWDSYQLAFEEALQRTSRPWAPWYAVPADDKKHMRLSIAGILLEQLKSLSLEFPRPTDDERVEIARLRQQLADELGAR